MIREQESLGPPLGFDHWVGLALVILLDLDVGHDVINNYDLVAYLIAVGLVLVSSTHL